MHKKKPSSILILSWQWLTHSRLEDVYYNNFQRDYSYLFYII